MLYSSGTTGRPKGVEVPLPDAPARHPRVDLHAGRRPVRRHRRQRLPLPRAAVPRRPAALLHGLPPGRRHRRRHGALRPRGRPRPDRAAPRHPQPVGADDVHPDAQAAGRRPRPLRRVVAAGRHPRRRALPGRGEGADDRVVGPGAARVLRRHRGQRVRLLRQRRSGSRTGAPSAPPLVGKVHIVDDDGEEVATGESGTIYFSGGAEFSYHNDPEKTAASRDPEGAAGRPWATSATSTTTATSTSPTARPT